VTSDPHRYGESGRYPRLWEACAYCLASAVVVVIGAANLYLPFGPDQALIFHGAKLLDEGAVYYVDYWDNKQPGLYWFYLVAGRAFGFSEFGIHMLELLWMLAFAVVLMTMLRGAFRRPWLSAFAPVATIGVYYGLARENELTQLEFLVSFPLFALVLCLIASHRRPKAMLAFYFASGLLAGVAVLFKLLLAPLCVGLWLFALVWHYRTHGSSIAELALRAVLPAALGVALVLGSIVLLYARLGHLDDLLWTAFVYPPQALAFSPPASKTRLITAAAFFLSGFAPWVGFALFASALWLWRRKDLLSALMLTWCVVGVALFLVQQVSWWHYHTLLVLFPAGILAVLGIDRLCDWLVGAELGRAARRDVLAALLVLTATADLFDATVRKAQPLLSSVAVTGEGVRGYQFQARVSEHYGRIQRGVEFLLQPDALPGPIYAFGNAMVYEFSGRASAHRTGGSSWEFYLPEQIDDILASLDRLQAPYVFVDRLDHKLFRLRPKVTAYLNAHYVVHHTDESGTWLYRRDLTEQRSGMAPGNS
jgi:hypothetical protein